MEAGTSQNTESQADLFFCVYVLSLCLSLINPTALGCKASVHTGQPLHKLRHFGQTDIHVGKQRRKKEGSAPAMNDPMKPTKNSKGRKKEVISKTQTEKKIRIEILSQSHTHTHTTRRLKENGKEGLFDLRANRD